MEKILVFGNNKSVNWSDRLSNYDVRFEDLESFTLNEDGIANINNTIVNKLGGGQIKAVILDVDGMIVPRKEERCIMIAMAIRLSLFETLKNALIPIFFASKMDQGLFRNFQFSSILFTEGISVNTCENVLEAIEIVEPLDAKQYKTRFLDIVKVLPNSTEGNHSLANQWGADALGRFFFGEDTNNKMIEKARLSMYFRYVRICALKIQDIEKLINGGKECLEADSKVSTIDAKGKKILLIDDEANKGWSDVLSRLLTDSDFETINEHVLDYNELSDSARNKIEKGNFDLIFLDLRMSGLEEEDNVQPEDFSGMKILKEIKKQNKGTQVIMLTASNKAWNMKALLDVGADGYYIKESPEYAFSISYSKSNAEGFCLSIERCLKRSYLRMIYSDIDKIKCQLRQNSEISQSLKDKIANQLNISFYLITKASEKQEYAFAYVTLEQILELITEEFIGEDNKFPIFKENGEDCNNWEIKNNRCCKSNESIRGEYSQWKKIASLYYQLLGGNDGQFGVEAQILIEKRNAFIHNDKKLLQRKIQINGKGVSIHQDIFSEKGFIRLFNFIKGLIKLL